MEAARLTDAPVEIVKQVGKDRLDPVADHIIVGFELRPIEVVRRQGRFGDAADDRDFGFELIARGMHETGRGMHHGHAVFHGDGLPSVRLDIDIAAREAGQDQRLLAMNKMAAVQFRGDSDRKPQPAHGGLGDRLIRHCRDEVTAKADENFGSTRNHGPSTTAWPRRLGGLNPNTFSI